MDGHDLHAVPRIGLAHGPERGRAGNQASSAAFTATVDTSPDAEVAVDLYDAVASAGGASVSFDHSGLDAGSTATVTFTASAGGSVVRSFTANRLQTADVPGLAADVSAAVLVTDAAGNRAAGAGDTLAADPVCFMPGTRVAVRGASGRWKRCARASWC